MQAEVAAAEQQMMADSVEAAPVDAAEEERRKLRSVGSPVSVAASTCARWLCIVCLVPVCVPSPWSLRLCHTVSLCTSLLLSLRCLCRTTGVISSLRQPRCLCRRRRRVLKGCLVREVVTGRLPCVLVSMCPCPAITGVSRYRSICLSDPSVRVAACARASVLHLFNSIAVPVHICWALGDTLRHLLVLRAWKRPEASDLSGLV